MFTFLKMRRKRYQLINNLLVTWRAEMDIYEMLMARRELKSADRVYKRVISTEMALNKIQ